jgi:hypothetical protein
MTLRPRWTIGRVDSSEVRNVVTIVSQRGRAEWKYPDRRDAQILEIIQFSNESSEFANSVSVTVTECSDVKLIDDGVFIPEWIIW